MKNVLGLLGFLVFLGFGRLLELIKENILSGFASRMDRLFIKGTDLRRDSTKNLYFCQTKADYVVRNTLAVSKKVRKNIDSEHI